MSDMNDKDMVFLALVQWEDEMGGLEVLSVHSTYDGAVNALEREGYEPTSEWYGKDPSERPYAYVHKMELKQ